MRSFALYLSVTSKELHAAAFDIDITDLLNQDKGRNLDKSDETSEGSIKGFDIEAVFDSKHGKKGKIQNKKEKHQKQYQIEKINSLPLAELLNKLDGSLEEDSPQNLLGNLQELLLHTFSSLHHKNSDKSNHKHEKKHNKLQYKTLLDKQESLHEKTPQDSLGDLQKLVSQSLSSLQYRNPDIKKNSKHKKLVKAQNLRPIGDLLDRDQNSPRDSLDDLQKLVSQTLSSLHHLNSKKIGNNGHNSKHQEQLQSQNLPPLIELLNKDEKTSQDLLGNLQKLLSQPVSKPHSSSDKGSYHKHKKQVQPNNLLGQNHNSFDLNDYSKIFVVLNPEAIKDMKSFKLDKLNDLLTLTEKSDHSFYRRLGASGERYSARNSEEYRPKRQQRSRYDRGGSGGSGGGRTAIPYIGKNRGEIYEKE